MTKKVNEMWGGHFSSGPADLMEKINASISFDKKLYSQDITGSIAHAKMLGRQGIIAQNESDAIVSGLQQILFEIQNGQFHFKVELEDIHMNIEHRLKEIIGEVAGKLHTARSRNDQVALDMKMFVRESCTNTISLLKRLCHVLLDKAQEYQNNIMPAFTHLQNAQPVSIGHYILAYVEMFMRDVARFQNCRESANLCPLGSGALAGVSYDIDRNYTAKELGFAAPTSNSLDSVSDRDYVAEFIFCASLAMCHVSRIAEELVLFSSKQFQFVSIGQNFTSGSSMMPQKRNPDAAELLRAKTGRVYGSLISLLTVMKGLPLAYSKDMQEDKESMFDAAETTALCIATLCEMFKGVKFNVQNCEASASQGCTVATDLADFLVQRHNIPFRQAHHIAGQVVVLSEQLSVEISALPVELVQKIDGRITKIVLENLTPRNSVKARTSFGGTGFSQVATQINTALSRLKSAE